MTEFLGGRVVLHDGDCLEVLRTLADNSVDSVVTDPPYHFTSIVKRFGGDNAAPAKHGTDGAFKRASSGFMGKQWDGGDIAFRVELWAEALRVLKPGSHMVAFSGTRTYHRMVCAIEDAGFEIRDQLAWVYGSGFPKSHNIGNGWGTALKPAWEPICLARKPLSEPTVAANVLRWGTGAINVGACRIGTKERSAAYTSFGPCHGNKLGAAGTQEARRGTQGEPQEYIGRWPANLCHDGSEEVLARFPETGAASASLRGLQHSGRHGGISDLGGNLKGGTNTVRGVDDEGGSAARFFYTAKADGDDRLGSKHPTVKPLDLIQWLCRLITPPRGIILDCFAGTGTIGEAAYREGFDAILIEREAEYQADIARRMALVLDGKVTRKNASTKARGRADDAGPLFEAR